MSGHLALAPASLRPSMSIIPKEAPIPFPSPTSARAKWTNINTTRDETDEAVRHSFTCQHCAGIIKLKTLTPRSYSDLIDACIDGRSACVAARLSTVIMDVDRPDAFGRTALHAACAFGNPECARLLLEVRRAVSRCRAPRGLTEVMTNRLTRSRRTLAGTRDGGLS